MLSCLIQLARVHTSIIFTTLNNSEILARTPLAAYDQSQICLMTSMKGQSTMTRWLVIRKAEMYPRLFLIGGLYQ